MNDTTDHLVRLMRQFFLVVNINVEDKYVKEFWAKAEAEIRNKQRGRAWLNHNAARAMVCSLLGSQGLALISNAGNITKRNGLFR